jgi:hypothetical protein
MEIEDMFQKAVVAYKLLDSMYSAEIWKEL